MFTSAKHAALNWRLFCPDWCHVPVALHKPKRPFGSLWLAWPSRCNGCCMAAFRFNSTRLIILAEANNVNDCLFLLPWSFTMLVSSSGQPAPAIARSCAAVLGCWLPGPPGTRPEASAGVPCKQASAGTMWQSQQHMTGSPCCCQGDLPGRRSRTASQQHHPQGAAGPV